MTSEVFSKTIKDYDLIIFDCDGTLVNSELLANTVSANLMNDLGLNEYTPHNFMEEFMGQTWTNIAQIIEKRHQIKLPDDIYEQYASTLNNLLLDNLEIVAGALELVEACNNTAKICVASNGQRSNVIKSLEIGHFKPHFFTEETIFTRIQVAEGKPAPDLFFYAAEKMSVTPEKCLVLEDSTTGVQAAVAADMDVIGVTAVSHQAEIQEKRLKKAGALAVFDQIIHIEEMLGL
ncbi:MAG: HAD family phosphatase [Pseudomonadota bacterium]